LSKLESLCITAQYEEDAEDAQLQLAAHEIPGQLTSLTKLQLPLWVVRDMGSIGGCVNLRDLQLEVAQASNILQIDQWGEREWDGLASLAHLTRLHISMDVEDVGEAPADAFYSVLRQLKGLRVVGACLWTPESLPVLQNLTQVTAIYGGWNVPAGWDAGGLVCPHIRELAGVFMRAPFRAFPNITTLTVYWISADCLSTLSYCCSSLQRLALAPDLVSSTPMTHGHVATCMSAMKSIAQLQHLTHLELAPADDAQLMAFTGVRAGLGALKLRYLLVRGPLSLFALVQLQSVHGLGELCVHVTEPQSSFTLEGVRVWLVSLAGVPKVSLVLCSEEQRSVVEAAKQWVAQLELPLPAVLKVTVQ
jgi:hypothetical protein